MIAYTELDQLRELISVSELRGDYRSVEYYINQLSRLESEERRRHEEKRREMMEKMVAPPFPPWMEEDVKKQLIPRAPKKRQPRKPKGPPPKVSELIDHLEKDKRRGKKVFDKVKDKKRVLDKAKKAVMEDHAHARTDGI